MKNRIHQLYSTIALEGIRTYHCPQGLLLSPWEKWTARRKGTSQWRPKRPSPYGRDHHCHNTTTSPLLSRHHHHYHHDHHHHTTTTATTFITTTTAITSSPPSPIAATTTTAVTAASGCHHHNDDQNDDADCPLLSIAPTYPCLASIVIISTLRIFLSTALAVSYY